MTTINTNTDFKKIATFGGGIGGIGGFIADVLTPLAPFSEILSVTFICVGVLLLIFIKKNKLKFATKTNAITAFISGVIFLALSLAADDDKGLLASHLPAIQELQESLNIVSEKLDVIDEKVDDILESQRKSEQNLQDIKDAVSGDAELKNMSNTGDLSVVKDINERTKDKNGKRVAILYFDNTSDEKKLDKLQKGLAGMLISDLTNVNMLSIVERDRLEEIIKEQKLSRTKAFDPETASKLGKLLGAELILTGAYFEMFGSFRIDARFIDVETGEILKSEGVDGETSNFFKLQKQLAWKIIKNLDVKLSEKEKDDLEEAETEQEVSYETALAYSTALDLIDAGETDKARKKLKGIIVDNPNFKPAKEELRKLQ
tara:strand:- start:130 stop:1251 length:1122 start_codon:yes stop_codon:yes gene_type:complete